MISSEVRIPLFSRCHNHRKEYFPYQVCSSKSNWATSVWKAQKARTAWKARKLNRTKIRPQMECDFKLSAITIFLFYFLARKKLENIWIFAQNCYVLWFISAILSQFAILASRFKYFDVTFPKLSSTFPAKIELSISIAATNRMRLLFFIFFQKLRLKFECDLILKE